jgi:nicotinamidase-related amidase
MKDYQITSDNALLLVIDIQANLAAAMKKEVYDTVEKNTGILISTARALSIPVLLSEQYTKGLGPTMDAVKQSLPVEHKPIEKISFSCWHEPLIKDALIASGRKTVIIAGIESHVCVLQTALDLLGNGFSVHVVSDAVCSRYKSDWKHAMHYLRHAGAIVTTTEIVSFQLLHKAGTPEFKQISPLFKNR